MLKSLEALDAEQRTLVARDLTIAALHGAQPLVRILGPITSSGPQTTEERAEAPRAATDLGEAVGRAYVACLSTIEGDSPGDIADAAEAAAIDNLQALFDLATDVYAHTAWLKSERRDNPFPDPNGTLIQVDDNGRSVYTLGKRLLELAVANGWEQPRG